MVKEGAQQTHQLRGLFASNFGHPGRTYITGHSQGGIIALMLAEKYPQHYDGALVMCSPVGGLRMSIDYFIDVRVLFDYFFPGVLPFPTSQDNLSIPEGIDFDTDVVPAVVGAVLADLPRAIEMAGVDQIELPFADVGQLINSILSPLFFVTVEIGRASCRERV